MRLLKLDSLETTFRMLFGALVTALGLAVLIGWYTNNLVLIQLSAELTPMQANTALCMLLSGLAILFLKNHRKIVILFSIPIFLISTLTLLQYIFGITIGLDQLLIKPMITTNTSYPGRMAPNTAVCFVFASVMFFASAFSNRFKLCDVVAIVLCIAVGILSLISLTGHFLGVPMLYAWGNVTAMAMHTATGFLSIALGCFLFLLNPLLSNQTGKNYLLMIIICAVSILLFLISWQALTMYQNNLIKNSVAQESIYGDDLLELLLSNRFDAITRLFLRGRYHDNYKTDFWKLDANTYLSTYSALQSISVEDSSTNMVLHIRNPQETITAKNNIKICHTLLQQQQQQQHSHVSIIKSGLKLAVNEQLFCIAGSSEKWVSVFDAHKLFEIVFSARTWKNYDIELTYQNRVLFSKNTHDTTDAFRKQWGISKQISILGQQWKLEIWPNEAFVETHTSLFPQLFLLFGLLVTILLIIAAHLWQLSVSKNKLLEQYARKLQVSNTTLESFAYAASHDLKAPLRVVDNTSKWLEEDLEPHLTPETRKHINLLRGRVQRMEKLLDDLLEYARIGLTQDERFSKMISGDTLMKDILELLSPPQTFLISIDPHFSKITLPTMPLQQIFMNLISNAIKHHDKTKGHIDVSVKEDMQYYIFAVRDDGPGISAEFHEKIFNLFQTLKPRDQVEGSGMGLALVKKNVELFGGTVHLESMIGCGSTFRFTWPKKITRQEEDA